MEKLEQFKQKPVVIYKLAKMQKKSRRDAGMIDVSNLDKDVIPIHTWRK